MGFFDWLKKGPARSSSSDQKTSTTKPQIKQPWGYTGHDRHFYFLQERGAPLNVVDAIANEILQTGQGVGMQHRELFHLCDMNQNLRFSAIFSSVTRTRLTAYPYDDSGFGWPIDVREIYPWANDIEGQISGSCMGARVSLFDTLFFKNKDSYVSGQPIIFLVNGLAYKMFEGEVPESVSHDYCFYLPLTEQEEGGVDEIKFSSQVEDVEEINFWGISMIAYTLTIATPEGFPLRLRMYAHPSAGPKKFATGDRISGIAWLFGFAKI
jgi:hypothetical protein